MLYWALMFLIIAIIAGVLGFGGIAIAAAGIAKILFFIFLVVFVVMLITGLMGRRKVRLSSVQPNTRFYPLTWPGLTRPCRFLSLSQDRVGKARTLHDGVPLHQRSSLSGSGRARCERIRRCWN